MVSYFSRGPQTSCRYGLIGRWPTEALVLSTGESDFNSLYEANDAWPGGVAGLAPRGRKPGGASDGPEGCPTSCSTALNLPSGPRWGDA